MSEFKPYLHSAHIEGYKSIVSCDVTFKPGLNIIIGKNGTGKTNLLEFLAAGLAFKVAGDGIATANLVVCNSNDDANIVIVNFLGLGSHNNHFGSHVNADFADWSGDTPWNLSAKSMWTELFPQSYPVFFRHQLPKGILLLDRPLRITARNRISVVDGGELDEQPFAIRMGIERLMSSNLPNPLNETALKKVIQDALGFVSGFEMEYKASSPVKGIRLSPQFSINNGMIDGSWDAFQLTFEFLVNGRWMRWEQLSDGTQRLALLLLEIYVAKGFAPERFEFNLPNYRGSSRFLLIEEPEIGLHPHQLHQTLNFIKEASQTEQVIITTHSPQVLDMLTKEELDRIIIAEFEPDKGSSFRHMTEKETKKALFIMKDEPLSHYWRYSDLDRNPILI